MESYQNAATGKYGYVRLSQRYKDIELPKVEVVDIKELRRRKMMNGPLLATAALGCPRGPARGPSGHPLPEPPRLCADDRVPHVRMGAKVR